MSERLRRGRVRFLPVLHGPFEFALEVRRAFAEKPPGAVAVEYPSTLEEQVRRAVSRLPDLSVVLYPESDETYVYLPIEPQDALVEATRLALEQDLPLALIDKDVEGYQPHREAFPDSHAIRLVGYVDYVLPLVAAAARVRPSPGDEERERTMAAWLQDLAASYDSVLCVLGVAHAARVMDLFGGPPLPRPFGRRHRNGARTANLAESSSREVLSEPGYIAAAYERARGSRPPETPPEKQAEVVRFGRRPGPEAAPPAAPVPAAGDRPEEAASAVRLEDLDRNRLNLELIQAAARRYVGAGAGRLTPLELRNLFRFTRNWAMLKGLLLPRLYELVIGARSVADDNLSFEVWDLGTTYPWQRPDPELSTVELKMEHLLLDGKAVRFRRKLGDMHRVPIPVKRRPEWRPQEWKERWRGFSVCSYPPEDVAIEGYGDYLRKRAVAALAEEGSRVEPFTSSLLDGIDIRETVRNWHQAEKVYVRENRPVRGKVGAVVVIFDPDDPAPGTPEGERYPWKLTWLGEHDQESDMALYATPPGEKLVGPGISRCEYGGFMMTYPPRRVFDIWEDPFFHPAPSKAERLLFAALAYSKERHVVYVAAKPPKPMWKTMASRLDRKLVYLPIGQFSPPMLRRIRTFHVLEGHRVRGYASDYIG